MDERVCPWWLGWMLASPLRRLRQEPAAILAPWVSQGMTVLEPGSGMGYFSIPLARLVGEGGRVICVDLQPQMLSGLARRARRAGLAARIETRACPADSLAIDDLRGKVDFVLAFAMVHEVASIEGFFREVLASLKAGGKLLLAEPTHVSEDRFALTLRVAREQGFSRAEPIDINRSRAAILTK